MQLHSDTSSSPPALSYPPLRYIWIVMGLAGSGKSTNAEFLARELRVPFIGADDYLPPEIISNITSGSPLANSNRWGWLSTLRDEATSTTQGCVLTCSCLRRQYRDFFRAVNSAGVVVRFVYLKLEKELVVERVRARKNHFFKEGMVDSQFETLEEPGAEETDVGVVYASGSREGVSKNVLEWVFGHEI